MNKIARIFNVFSKTPEALAKPRHDVPETTRNRVFLWCQEVYSNSRTDLGTVGKGDYNFQFWGEVYRRLLMRTGQLQLSPSGDIQKEQEAARYVLNCPADQFLDFLEDIFSAECFFHVSLGDNLLVDELNDILRQDNLPYSITHFVKETVKESSGRTVTYTRALPRVIMKESEFLHVNAIEPALKLLERPHFQNANTEFLAALEDYRKGDLPDCLTKCGSAFESVLKILCDRRHWTYKQSDTASTLIKIVLSNTSLDSYFEQLLIIVATLRNRLSASHGAGTVPRQPSQHLAHYALNVTASAIVLLAQETGEY